MKYTRYPISQDGSEVFRVLIVKHYAKAVNNK